MPEFRQQKTIIGPGFAAIAAVLLLLAAVAITLYSEYSFRDQKIREIRAQAQVLATTVSAALSFNDREAAEEYVGALRANPEVQVAAIYNADGQLFARFSRLPDRPPLQREWIEEPTAIGGDVIVQVPVVEGNIGLGIVHLRAVMEPFANRLPRYSGVALLVLMAGLFVALQGMAQARLARAHLELQQRTREVGEINRRLETQIAEREKIESALRQAQKMEAVGQLTGGVAHDFNNMLVVIMGNIERLQRRLRDREDVAELLKAADNAMLGAQRAAGLTKSLLAFSRRQPLDPKPIDPNKLVTGMSNLLRRSLGESIAIETVLAGGLWRIQADPNQLENAILNLAVNARDAMRQGGKLTIETANAFLDKRYAETADIPEGQYVVLCISDTGTGMTPEIIDRAFEPFFTTKEVGQGTGLGLSQVYGYVKQSGGHVKIYSEIGRGTTVKIYLPRLLGDTQGVELEGAPVERPPTAHAETVLLVEDDDAVRTYSHELLIELGYRVIAAENGHRALQLLEQHRDVDLLFTDVGLPGGMNGRQLADEAVRRFPHLKVLFTTGYARNAIVHDGRLDPGVHLITKPFNYGDLAAMLRKVLDSAGG